MLKKDFIQSLYQQLEAQESSLRQELESLDAEMANETKSSAGDKFETSREMMSQSRQGLSKQLAHLKEQLYFLSQVSQSAENPSIQAGSFIQTDQGYFFFGLALGRLRIEGNEVMALSFQSPLGKAFLGKQQGDSLAFRKQIFNILSCR